MLDNVLLMVAVEEEFAVDIPENEANKISTTAYLIDYLATPSTSQMGIIFVARSNLVDKHRYVLVHQYGVRR